MPEGGDLDGERVVGRWKRNLGRGARDLANHPQDVAQQGGEAHLWPPLKR